MTPRGLGYAWLVACVAACGPTENPGPAVEPGDPLPGLSDGERGRFLLGRALFERLATADEGLGPLYNAERCSACHDVPAVGGGGSEVLVLKATRYQAGRCDRLERLGGDNIQRRATELLMAHGMGPEQVPEGADTALVTAPPLFGLGLLEAVPDSVLLAAADPTDRDGDGISGRLPRTEDGRTARFGRKGDAVAVRDFVDSALRFELGFTTPEHLQEEPRNGEPIPAGADPMADPEIDAETLDLLTDYVRLLAPPAPEVAPSAAARDSVDQGAALFSQIGCALCHSERLVTGASDLPGLRERSLQPYSDMLLHDLGPDLADVCGVDAAPAENRTAPLWGLRHRTRLLHDGRASDPLQAVSAHGGEGGPVRDAFFALPEEGRSLLLRFLRSL